MSCHRCGRVDGKHAESCLKDTTKAWDTDDAEALPVMRQFESGATRHTDAHKLDYDGFLSPIALEAFAQYMHEHRTQANGQQRASDNWQKGIPTEAYRKSLMRHVIDYWALSRGHVTRQVNSEYGERGAIDSIETKLLCAIWFNVQGLLHELGRR